MLYFNSTSVVGDMSCVQFQTVMDTIVEEDEVVTFRAVPRNILEVFYEENDLISLTVFDNDGTYQLRHLDLTKHALCLATNYGPQK